MLPLRHIVYANLVFEQMNKIHLRIHVSLRAHLSVEKMRKKCSKVDVLLNLGEVEHIGTDVQESDLN